MNGNAIDAALLAELLDHFGARPRPDRTDGIRYSLRQCEARILPWLPDSFPEFTGNIVEVGRPGVRLEHTAQLRAGSTLEIRLLADRFSKYRLIGAVESAVVDLVGNYLSTIQVFDTEIFSPTLPRQQ